MRTTYLRGRLPTGKGPENSLRLTKPGLPHIPWEGPDIPQNPQTSGSTVSTLHPINVAMISVTEQARTKLKGGKEQIPVFPAWVQGEQLPLALDCLPTHPCLVGRLAEPQPHPAWSMFDLDPGLMVMVGLDL